MKSSGRWMFAVAAVCLFISGAAGLVYEIVWARYLALFLGHTSYAVIAVLVAFMGGLALGNFWLGTRADRSPRPLALYAWLEIFIGLYALVFPFYFDLCHQAYAGLARSWQPGGAGLLVLKFGFSFLSILLPTVLMGGTLPVMTRLVTRTLGELRGRVAALYFINSTGAVAGCWLADFWWLPALGLQATVFAGAAMNLLVGAAALYVSRWLREGTRTVATASPEVAAADEEIFTRGELKWAVIGIGVSGFVAMLYEVVWTRLLALALGSSTHAFSLMLMTFITGIAAGAWVVNRWKKLRRTIEAFAWAELALAATMFISMFFYEGIPYAFAKLAGLLARRDDAYPLYELLQAFICFGVMFVPTVCLGMTLPLASRIATVEVSGAGRSVGTVFSVNTLGTVLGAALTGLWLMPSLGLARTLALGIALNAALGGLLLGQKKLALRRALKLLIPLGTVALVWFSGVRFDGAWQRTFSLGLWRELRSPASLAEFRDLAAATRMKYYRDGAGATVCVTTWREGNADHLALKVNGKVDAGTKGDVSTQLLLGHIPMLLRPEARQALVIGLGSGMTCGAVLRHPAVLRLDAVELLPEVVEAARLFGARNHDVLHNSKLHVAVEDAKSFLQTTAQSYDAIISEPSNPWMAGVAGVFSREYYETCRARLRPGGVMAQWVQIYETSDEALEMVMATFSAVFPHLSVWQTSLSDLILMGSVEPLNVDLDALEKRFQEPAVKSDLMSFDLFRLPALLALEMISPYNARYVPAPGARQHSDYFPALEYVAQRAFFVQGGARIHHLHDENYSTRPSTLLAQYLQKHPLTEDDFKALALFRARYQVPGPALFRSMLYRWQQDFPTAITPLQIAAESNLPTPSAEAHAQAMARSREIIWQRAGKEPELLQLYAQYLMETYRAQRSVFYTPPAAELQTVLDRLVAVDSGNQRIHKLRLAELAWDRGDDAACLRLGQSAFDPNTAAAGPINFHLDPKAPAIILARMIETLWRAGKMAEAEDLCQQAGRNGYLGKQSLRSDPILEMTVRKVQQHGKLVQTANTN